MQTTVRRAIEDASSFISALTMQEDFDQKIEVSLDENFGLVYDEVKARPDRLFVEDLQVDDVIEFDYTDLEGNESRRSGIVRAERKVGKYGDLMMIFNTEKDKPQWFYERNIKNISLVQPT